MQPFAFGPFQVSTDCLCVSINSMHPQSVPTRPTIQKNRLWYQQHTEVLNDHKSSGSEVERTNLL